MNRIAIYLVSIFSIVTHMVNAQQHNHKLSQKPITEGVICQPGESRCAKTITTVFAPNGDLWRLWVNNQQLFYQISSDHGAHFGQVKSIGIAKENIAARNENRPKIGFDDKGGIYLSWAVSGKKRFTGDVRFSYSLDNGKSFAMPITVNNDGLVTGHSFNEMLVSPDGEVQIVWLDGRYRYMQRKAGKDFNGSELYLAKGNPRKSIVFNNESLATGTCVCCRIAIDTDNQGNLAIFWRHIFGDNIREFALITLDDERQNLAEIKQISEDHWYIEGCPHQGGGLSITENNRYHLVWYNQGDKGKGNFYAYSDDAGQTKSKPFTFGNLAKQAAHPNISHHGDTVDIVWLEFDGQKHSLWHQQSKDGGRSFNEAKILANSTTGADRPFIISQGNKSIVSWHRPNTGHWVAIL